MVGGGRWRGVWAVVWLVGWAVAAVEGKPPMTAGQMEKECRRQTESGRTSLALLVVGPVLLNLVCLGLLGLSLSRVLSLAKPQEEVFQAAMQLTRTTLKVGLPGATLASLHRLIPDPRAALAQRLTEENAQEQRRRAPQP